MWEVWDSGGILEAEFTAELVWDCETEHLELWNYSRVFVLNKWKNVVAIFWDGEDWGWIMCWNQILLC